MKSEKYLELYLRYIKGHLTINDILLYPFSYSDDGVMMFEMSNPNDVSYSYSALAPFAEDSIRSFQELTGLNNKVNRPILRSVNDEEVYVNQGLTQEITKFLKSVKVLKTKTHEIIVKSVNVKIIMEMDDTLKVINYVKPLKAFVYGIGGREKSEIEKAVRLYEDYQRKGKYNETEENYEKIDDILDHQQESLVDPDWMVQYVATKFV